ncbi:MULTISPECIES: hypothetical protein [unclassified Streptomyces]|uniref:hypothetical protein n=1 Tax=unclassified Streptomyces TaxID=2593676 RepID=UPI002E290E0F|nr:hypothetical protein [Streptomyces sp. NBC_00223]
MATRFMARTGLVLGTALLGMGVLSSSAQASPPPGSGFFVLGYFRTEAQCVDAAQANYPVHGPVYICEPLTNGLYALWMH